MPSLLLEVGRLSSWFIGEGMEPGFVELPPPHLGSLVSALEDCDDEGSLRKVPPLESGWSSVASGWMISLPGGDSISFAQSIWP